MALSYSPTLLGALLAPLQVSVLGPKSPGADGSPAEPHPRALSAWGPDGSPAGSYPWALSPPMGLLQGPTLEPYTPRGANGCLALRLTSTGC